MSETLTATELKQRKLADLVRAACVRAALDGYERASFDGLCHEGAWECALEAMRTLDLDELIQVADRSAA